MKPGKLRHRVTIQQKTQARTSMGAESDAWSDIATVWASIEPVSGREYYAARQEQSEVSHKVTIRYRRGVTPDCRLEYGDRYFEIETVIDTMELHRELVLMCKERTPWQR